MPKSTAAYSAAPFVDVDDEDIAALTPRITSSLLVALAVQRVVLGSVPLELGAILLGGVVKAVTWLLAIETVCLVFALTFEFVVLTCAGSSIFMDRRRGY